MVQVLHQLLMRPIQKLPSRSFEICKLSLRTMHDKMDELKLCISLDSTLILSSCIAGVTASTDQPNADTDQQELADLQAVLEDMYDKVDELKQVLKEYLSTKNSIKVPGFAVK